MILPNFLIIGAARSGTTGLYNNILQHPEIDMPVKKEIHFFSHKYEMGLDYYKSYFKNFTNSVIGEASVSYTYPHDYNIAQRICDTLGNTVKIVYMIREPVARTISHYNYYRYYGLKEDMDIEQALEEKPIYKGTSRYSAFISQYEEVFGRSNMHIMVFEEYIKNPLASLRDLFDFLEVDTEFIPKDADKKTNETFNYRYKPLYKMYFKLSRSPLRFAIESSIDPSRRKRARNFIRSILGSSRTVTVDENIRKMLISEFRPEIEKLENILDRDLSIWMNQYEKGNR